VGDVCGAKVWQGAESGPADTGGAYRRDFRPRVPRGDFLGLCSRVLCRR
jgi:hypothetical protein